MTFILSFITMFMLVKYLTKSALSGAVAGCAYSLCPYHFSHECYITLYNIQWIPLFALSLCLLERNRTLYLTVISSLLWACVAYGDAYYGYMTMIMAGIFMLWNKFDIKIILRFLIFSILLIMPFALWSITDWQPRVLISPIPVVAKLSDYFYPNWGNGIEHYLYILPAWIILAGIGLRKHNLFWGIICLLCLFLSLVEPICPIFRVSARWGIMVMLGVSVLAGYGFKRLLQVEQKEVN